MRPIFTKSLGQLEGDSPYEKDRDGNNVLFLNGNLILRLESPGLSGTNIRKMESAALYAECSHPSIPRTVLSDGHFFSS